MVKLKKDCNTGGCDNVFSCCYWKEKINRAWELATTSVRSIKVNGGEPQYPDGDGAVDVKVTVDTTEIQNQIDAISGEVDQLTSDVMDNSTDIINLSNLKENVLSAGDGIDIDRASSSTPIISTNVVAQNSDGMFSVWKNETKIAELTEGENVTIGPTGEVSAVDTKYTAGANVTITADNVISATGELSGTASADQILLNDNRSVQSAIDAIEDEIGDSTTGGTIQSRLEALEESTANLDTEMAGKQDALTDAQMSAVNSGATADKINAIDTNTSNINQLTSVVDTANADISALKQADVELSKAYSGFEVTKGTAGKVGLTMTAVDGMTSASQDILTAGTNISITNGKINATDTKYTAGANISISSGNVISSTGGLTFTYSTFKTISEMDNFYTGGMLNLRDFSYDDGTYKVKVSDGILAQTSSGFYGVARMLEMTHDGGKSILYNGTVYMSLSTTRVVIDITGANSTLGTKLSNEGYRIESTNVSSASTYMSCYYFK